ncbi:hypothetical protein MKX01_028831 [Papaver californicum]|nr:hypothetical protein MKX01_028831 [Papaver californicum]
MPVPQLTPSRIRLLTCNRTFSCSKAKDRIFYTPIVSLQLFMCFLRIPAIRPHPRMIQNLSCSEPLCRILAGNSSDQIF